jgi:tetratricopeptide (TPR) repeat protein
VFRDRVKYRDETKAQLAVARTLKAEPERVDAVRADAVRAIEASLGTLADQEAGVVIDLYLSYRAVKAWADMIALVRKMSPPLARSVMVQEQLGLALNRAGNGDEAERVLQAVLDSQGPSSETYGILGRVYKDRWEAALKAGDPFLADGLLDNAIDAYLKGFEADWRDAYPGVNAVTLMEVKEPPDPRRAQLIPVVTYAVERRIAAGKPDYWDFATQIELAVLAKNKAAASAALRRALPAVREGWEPETTGRNLRLIREARERRGDPVDWAAEVEQTLARRPTAP